MGVMPEEKVGICVERGLEMVVGIMGILKAGGAYVPLDPAYPKERLGFMLEDAGARVLVTREQWQGLLGGYEGQVIFLEREGERIRTEPQSNLSVAVQAENLAYVIYTSGSTGKPKGVGIRHGGLRNLVKARAEEFEIQAANRVLQFASL